MTKAKASLEDALDELPIFPLPHVVLFPHAVLPLHVFEPRYRTMLADCLKTHRAIAIAQILQGSEDDGKPRIARVSGGGIVVEHQELADGRSNIVVLGQARLRLEERAAG
ncbi:MAG TPA: LON peptidase substrate-binding domain-containing protein, partial [Labilithrix sp.]